MKYTDFCYVFDYSHSVQGEVKRDIFERNRLVLPHSLFILLACKVKHCWCTCACSTGPTGLHLRTPGIMGRNVWKKIGAWSVFSIQSFRRVKISVTLDASPVLNEVQHKRGVRLEENNQQRREAQLLPHRSGFFSNNGTSRRVLFRLSHGNVSTTAGINEWKYPEPVYSCVKCCGNVC